jgi:CBS domain-containing protein
MDAHVVWLSAHQPAADAARAAVAEDVEVCAVCDATGRLVGLVRADDLVDAVLNAPQTPVRQLTAPADERTVAAPDDVLTDVLRRAGVNAWVAVVDGEQVVGVVSPARVRSALRRGVVAADRERVGAGS